MFRSGIETATERKALTVMQFSSDVSSIDSNGRRTGKAELARHSFVPARARSSRHTLCSQDISDQLHRRRMRRAFRYIQDFNFHASFSGFRARVSLKIGRSRHRLPSLGCNWAEPSASRVTTSEGLASLCRTSESFSSNRRRTGAHGCNRFARRFKKPRISLSLNPSPCTRRIKASVSTERFQQNIGNLPSFLSARGSSACARRRNRVKTDTMFLLRSPICIWLAPFWKLHPGV